MKNNLPGFLWDTQSLAIQHVCTSNVLINGKMCCMCIRTFTHSPDFIYRCAYASTCCHVITAFKLRASACFVVNFLAHLWALHDSSVRLLIGRLDVLLKTTAVHFNVYVPTIKNCLIHWCFPSLSNISPRGLIGRQETVRGIYNSIH